MAKNLLNTLSGVSNQEGTMYVRGSEKEYTVATIATEVQNLTSDGLRFMNDWLNADIQLS